MLAGTNINSSPYVDREPYVKASLEMYAYAKDPYVHLTLGKMLVCLHEIFNMSLSDCRVGLLMTTQLC